MEENWAWEARVTSAALGLKEFVLACSQVQENEGVMEMSDLEGYTVLKQQPVVSTFKGWNSFSFQSFVQTSQSFGRD